MNRGMSEHTQLSKGGDSPMEQSYTGYPWTTNQVGTVVLTDGKLTFGTGCS